MILQDKMNDICSVWEKIYSMILLQHIEIIISFENNIIQKVHRYNNKLYVHLCGVVSRNAIDHIAAEYDHVKYVCIYKFECHCTIRITDGMPYACEIVRYSMISCSSSLDTNHV